MLDHRRDRAELLAGELNIDPPELPKLLDRYAATATQATDPDARGYFQTFPTFTDACQELADGVLDGYAPAGVYDLDSGELIELHVSTPAVTRSLDQGITVNPLETAGQGPKGSPVGSPSAGDRPGSVSRDRGRRGY